MNKKDRKEGEQPEEDQAKVGADQEEREKPPLSEVDNLRQQLEAKELEAKQNHERFLRQLAEMENFKKRTAREKEETIKYGNEGLVRDLLPILDNLERAVEHAQGGGNGKPLLEGIEMILKSLLEVLQKHGVTQISAKGEPFDPQKHEAFAQVESEDLEANTVVEELHKGYLQFDRLLRPSLVSVAKSPETKKKESDPGEVENGEGDD
ncbi:MAG: nucleotide exchange factor GrpE [Candidatus Binatia bacterium]|jgi:molecular chaperone GrpE